MTSLLQNAPSSGEKSSHSSVRTRFKTPEGRFHLLAERTAGVIAFNYQRSTRLTLAALNGGSEDGTWLIYNVGDMVSITRHDAVHKEPAKVINCGSAQRASYPTSHAFAAARDGVDLLVGLADGQVLVMSLRAQLQSNSPKPVLVSGLTPEGSSNDNSRCIAVAWVPKSDPPSFVAAFSSSSIYLYKKSSVTGEGGSKFLSSLGPSKPPTPASTFSINGGGINDVALSPDGRTIVAACRDGALRVLDIGTGTVVGGFQAYYGALLCCCFSPDGRYVAAGGEDDLVAVYGMQERFPVMHCQGHRSWVSQAAFDPWAPVNETAFNDISTRNYRLGSVGQDSHACLWDIQLPADGDVSAGALLALMPPMKRSASTSTLSASMRHPNGDGGNSSTQGGGGHSHHSRKASLGKSSGICPSLPQAEMVVTHPIMEHRLHLEPMSDILFAEDCMYTADHCGGVRVWARPPRPQRLLGGLAGMAVSGGAMEQ